MTLKSHAEQYAKNFHLTDREAEVLFLLLNRVVSPKDIGKQLNISLHTVNNHLKKILEKTKSDSKTELLSDFLLYLESQKNQDITPVMPRVMILDDESDMTKMLQSFFQRRNIETQIYSDPIKALEDVRKHKIDVIISDIRMPKLNGVGFLQELRKLHNYEPGVIFISAYPEEYSMDTLLDLGAYAFLEKPLDLEKLYRLVWEYVYGAKPQNEQATPASVTVCLGNICFNTNNLGFGGLFLEQEKMKLHSDIQLEPGSRVELNIQLPNSEENHKAICEVIWKRSDASQTPGYGLKFLELDKSSKRLFMDLVRTNNILSFIPKG